MDNLKRTPFYQKEKELGGRFTDFGGWELPIRYTSQIEEHLIVRDGVGVFDVSHMGEIFIEGDNALKQVNYLVTNDVNSLSDGDILYTPMMNKKGGVVDDLLVYRIDETHFLLVVNAANIEKDFAWMVENNKYDTKITNSSENYVQLAVQGKDSENVLKKIFLDSNIEDIKYYNFKTINYNGDELILSRTGYTGEDGFELYFSPKFAEEIWDKIFLAGAEYNIKPIGLGARDTLRLEKKMALYGHELSDEISPIEAALKWTVKLDKDEFIGKDFILANKGKLKRKLVGVELLDKGVIRHGDKLFNDSNEEIGFVTSGTKSPSLKKSIALVMVSKKYTKRKTEFFVQIRNKMKRVRVIKTPFL